MNSVKHDNFDALKQEAYRIALDGYQQNYNDNWFQTNMEIYQTAEENSIFEKAYMIYRKFLCKEISEFRGEELMLDIEEEFNEKNQGFDELIALMFSFGAAVNAAFEKSGQEFGTVGFVCPRCNGRAYAQRHNTPNNIAHKTTVRQGCSDCGYSMMN